MSSVKLVFVEDFYGVGFHEVLIGRIGSCRSRISTLGGYRCNHKIVRVALAPLTDYASAKILFIIDTEGENSRKAKKEILKHFEIHAKRHRIRGLLGRVRVVTVEPRHEKWLCVGLGLGNCSSPEHSLSRMLGRPYEKRDLEKLAHRVRVERLRRLRDFREYEKAIEWLCNDP